MKKILIILALISLSGVSILAQTSRGTRPRVVKSPAPQTDSRPPVLRGGANEDIGEPPPLPTPPPVEDDEIIKIETNLVTMPVTVLDRNGRFVPGLQQRDFQVFEDGKLQELGFFAKVETPFTVILMLDVSPSTRYEINEIHNAAISFVNQLRRDDRVMVVAFDQTIEILSRPTNNRAVLESAIRRAKFGDGTSLYDAVDQMIRRELPAIEGRKAVVLFTDGVDTTSRRSNYQSTIRQTEEIDALFYPIRYDTYQSYGGGQTTRTPQPRRRPRTGGIIGILGDILSGGVISGTSGGGGGAAGTSAAEYETGKRYLEDLARNSGGRKFEATTTANLESAFAGIAEELRQQYTLGYYPAVIGNDGDRKNIRVRVMRPNLIVRAKSSYIVGRNAS